MTVPYKTYTAERMTLIWLIEDPAMGDDPVSRTETDNQTRFIRLRRIYRMGRIFFAFPFPALGWD
jgi:hypothetical protein